MRTYKAKELKEKSSEELGLLLSMVKTNEHLTNEEKSANIELIEVALNGGIKHLKADILNDIKMCEADTNDLMQGN